MAVRRVLTILVPTLSFLAGCTTLQSPGHEQPAVSVTPSLAVPQPGLHAEAALSVGDVSISSLDSNGPFAAVEGGLLWQPELRSETAFGIFASTTLRGLAADIFVAPDPRSIWIELTPAQRATVTAESADFSADANLQVGLTGKWHTNLYSVFAHGVVQYETGPSFDYRQRVDHVGPYSNLSSRPLTWGAGIGTDMEEEVPGGNSAGATLELLAFQNRTQSWYEGLDSHGNTVTTKPGGADYGSPTLILEPHWEFGRYILSLDLVLDLFGLGHSVSVTGAYRL